MPRPRVWGICGAPWRSAAGGVTAFLGNFHPSLHSAPATQGWEQALSFHSSSQPPGPCCSSTLKASWPPSRPLWLTAGSMCCSPPSPILGEGRACALTGGSQQGKEVGCSQARGSHKVTNPWTQSEHLEPLPFPSLWV